MSGRKTHLSDCSHITWHNNIRPSFPTAPKKMLTHRAIVQEVASGPLTLQTVERSVLGATELLVRVEAVALNVTRPRHLVLTSDCANMAISQANKKP